MPDYILAVDEESRRIVFVNKAIRNSSVMTASQIDEFISKPFEDLIFWFVNRELSITNTNGTLFRAPFCYAGRGFQRV